MKNYIQYVYINSLLNIQNYLDGYHFVVFRNKFETTTMTILVMNFF